jgi:hypothetical protein
MRREVTFLAVTLLFALSLTASPLQLTAPNPPGGQAPIADKTYQGQLSKVDLTAKTIVVKGEDNKDMTFTFNDQTQITGVDNSPQGLTGKTGSSLRVTYRDERGNHLASKIEVTGAVSAPKDAPRETPR